MAGNCSFGQHRAVRLATVDAGVGLADPARRGAGPGERLLEDVRRHLPDRGDGADRRDRGKPAADLDIDFRRHSVAAIGAAAGTDGQRLGLHAAETRFVAAPHIGLEGGFVLADLEARMRAARRQARAFRFHDQAVDRRLVVVERAVDAVHLLDRHDIGGNAVLDLVEARIIGLLEGFEGLHEVVEGIDDVERRRYRGLPGDGCGRGAERGIAILAAIAGQVSGHG